MNCRQLLTSAVVLIALPLLSATAWMAEGTTANVLDRIRGHGFQPTRDGFTSDRTLKKPGVASLEDSDWKVSTLAVRDLVSGNLPGNLLLP